MVQKMAIFPYVSLKLLMTVERINVSYNRYIFEILSQFFFILGLGCKLKMDDVGNVLVKRITRGTAVSIKNTTEESAVSNDILKLSNGVLSPDQPYKVRVPTDSQRDQIGFQIAF